jgi:hypothetical protein
MVESPETEEWALNFESAMMQHFRYQATRLALPDLPSDWDKLGWWEVMQHHGVPTRLLDWTTSPFVALWFAIQGHQDGAGDMAIWIYDRATARLNLQGQMTELKDVDGYDEMDYRHLQNGLVKIALSSGTNLLIPVVPRQFPRSVAQQSVLTVSPNIASALPGSQFVRHRLATRVLIREEWKDDIRATCRSMGITRLSLFRDFDSLRQGITELFMASREVPADPFW